MGKKVTSPWKKIDFWTTNLFYNFLENFTSIWSFLDQLCKSLKKTEICSFSQNFDRELINYSGMWTYTDMRFFAKVAKFKRFTHWRILKFVRLAVRTLLAGKWTPFEKIIQKWPVFRGFQIISDTFLYGMELKF